MLNPEIEKLVDRDLIARANNKMVAAETRLRIANSDLEAATATLKDAKRTAAGLPSLEAEESLERAERAARVAAKMHTAATDAHRKIADWLLPARGAAFAKVYMAGVKARLAAARKADDARKLLAEATQDFKNATGICHNAYSGGHEHIGNVANNYQSLADENAERYEQGLWSGNRVDVTSDSNEWSRYVLSQEPK